MENIKLSITSKVCRKQTSAGCINHGEKNMFIKSICKPCNKEIMQKYYEANKVKLLANSNARYTKVEKKQKNAESDSE